MSRGVRVTPEAERDLDDARRWYEQAQRGLGGEFLDAVLESAMLAVDHPEAFAVVHRDVRRILLRRFPYGLYYVVHAEEIVVIGCFHARRDPIVWRERTEEPDGG